MTIFDVLLASIQWYLALSMLGLVALPLLFMTCGALPDRGFAFVRPAGMAIVPLPLWIVGNAVGAPFNTWILFALVALIGIPAWTLAIRKTGIVQWVTNRWRWLLLIEMATLALFTSYVLFRGFAPDIAGTEKPMELALLNASLHSGELPVPDPWFAGEPINYYYFGYVAVAAVAHLAGLPGEIAFNLALASVFATATVGAAALAANLSILMGGFNRLNAITAACLAGFFIAFAGNLHAGRSFLSDPGATISESWWDGTGWASSRVIEDTFHDGSVRTVITEFPAFSWILGDLHPHVIAYPWLILGLALVTNVAMLAPNPRDPLKIVLAAFGTGIALGLLFSSNTWDLPVLGALGIFALWSLVSIHQFALAARAMAALLGGALLSGATFVLTYETPTVAQDTSPVPVIGQISNSLGYVNWGRSSVAELLTHWGAIWLLLLVIVVAFVYLHSHEIRERPALPAAITATLLLVAVLLQAPAIALFGIPALLSVYLLRMSDAHPVRFTGGMMVTGLLVLCLIEFLFMRDPFGDRMNTVFKFSFQTWAILTIGLSALIPVIAGQLYDRYGEVARRAVLGISALAIVGAAIYTPVSAYQWTNGFSDWRGLDGIEYIEEFQPPERAAINWLNETDESIEVVLEAPGCAYGSDNLIPHSRVSMATGLPTVIGWDGHQRQWRRGQPEHLAQIAIRVEFANALYEDPASVDWQIDDRSITHVYVGEHERAGYQRCELGPPYDLPARQELLDLGWEVAFEEGEVTIYRLPRTNSPN